MSFIRKKFLVGRRSLEKYANYYDKVRGKGEEYMLVKIYSISLNFSKIVRVIVSI